MNLKYKLLTQNMLVLICTIAVTGFFGFAYVYIHDIIDSAPGVKSDAELILLKDDNVIYKNDSFSNIQVKEILMNISAKKFEYTFQNTKYKLKLDSFNTNSEKYKIVRLIPAVSIGEYYKPLILFVIITFLLTFLIASIAVQRLNFKNIVNPVLRLKKETENLRMGELETAIKDEGYNEVMQLGREIEQLRLKLKDSVYYRERSDENRKFLISSISHDLKTPITSIRGYIDGVLDGVADTDEKKCDYLKKAIGKTILLSSMIEDLLLYSKLDLNQMPFKPENIDIVKYMADCISDNTVDFNRRHKKLVLENSLTASVSVNIDVEKFNRVVQNILDNAKKNIESGTGVVTVIIRETKSSVILEFRDNGKGIGKEDLPFIFDKFYRADCARSVEGSSGLGLAIAKQIVEGLGGRIWAVSNQGEGASILISLKKDRLMQ